MNDMTIPCSQTPLRVDIYLISIASFSSGNNGLEQRFPLETPPK